MGEQLLRRLQTVIRKWPVDPTRKGRDLGEFLRDNYLHQFKKQPKNNPLDAEAAVNSLERLVSDHQRKSYPRENEHSFCEGLVVKQASVLLSNESQLELGEKSRTVWERIMGKRKPGIGDTSPNSPK